MSQTAVCNRQHTRDKSPPVDRVVLSQPILTIVLTQAPAKYATHVIALSPACYVRQHTDKYRS
jgi:hypothetical protein